MSDFDSIFHHLSDFESNLYNVSDFASKVLPGFRFWARIIIMCQASKYKIYNVSYFEWKFSPLDSISIKNFTKCQILIDEIWKESEFELKTSKSVSFWKRLHQKSQVDRLCSTKVTYFAASALFQKHLYWKNNSACCVRFVMKKVTTCRILNWKFYNVSNLEMKNLQRVKF